MDMNEILHVSTFAGKIMLESGAETYRVEETICRICKTYGADEAESFVTPTGMMISIYNKGKTYSLIRRISKRTIDLDKVDKVNDLSRNIANNKLSVSELKSRLQDINNNKRYGTNITILLSGLAAFCFVFLFNGHIREAISSFFIGIVIKSLYIKFSNLQINDFFINIITSAITAILAILFLKIGFITDIDTTIISSIMLLVPGLAITNAIRDTLSGDLVAGITRASEAFLVAVSVAIGSGSILSFWISNFGNL